MIVQVEVKSVEEFGLLFDFVNKTFGDNRDPSPQCGGAIDTTPEVHSASGGAPSAADLGAAFKALDTVQKAEAQTEIGKYMGGLGLTNMSDLSDGQRNHVSEIITKISGIPF